MSQNTNKPHPACWGGVTSCSGRSAPARSAPTGWWWPPAAPPQNCTQSEPSADSSPATAGLWSAPCYCAGSPSRFCPLMEREREREEKHKTQKVIYFYVCVLLFILYLYVMCWKIQRWDSSHMRNRGRMKEKEWTSGPAWCVFDVCVCVWCVCRLPVMSQYISCGLMGPLPSTSIW